MSQYKLRFVMTVKGEHSRWNRNDKENYTGPKVVERLAIEADNMQKALMAGWKQMAEWDISRVSCIEFYGPELPVDVDDLQRSLQNRFYNASLDAMCMEKQLEPSVLQLSFPYNGDYLKSRDRGHFDLPTMRKHAIQDARDTRVNLLGQADSLNTLYKDCYGQEMPPLANIYVSEFMRSILGDLPVELGRQVELWLEDCDYEAMATWVGDNVGPPIWHVGEGQPLDDVCPEDGGLLLPHPCL